jgi:uncharacterized membrane protein YdbT with pleckstrin-like domain
MRASLETEFIMDEEQNIWEGHASHLINLPVYLLCALAAGALLGGAFFLSPPASYAVAGAAVVPLFIGMIKWLANACRRYQVTTERLRLSRGILSRKTDEVELYRVKDYVLVEPFWLRVFGLGDIVMQTTDDANPIVRIRAIPQAPALRDQIRKYVEICRERKHVRITEFE